MIRTILIVFSYLIAIIFAILFLIAVIRYSKKDKFITNNKNKNKNEKETKKHMIDDVYYDQGFIKDLSQAIPIKSQITYNTRYRDTAGQIYFIPSIYKNKKSKFIQETTQSYF